MIIMAFNAWKIEFPSSQGTKTYLASFLSEIEKKPEIGGRILENELMEADLFFLMNYLSGHFYFGSREYQFQLAN